MSKSKRKSNQRWRVSRIRGSRNETVGVVLAPDREAAIEVAIIENKIDEPGQATEAGRLAGRLMDRPK